MKRKKRINKDGRVCIVMNSTQQEMLQQLADDERKSFSSIMRDGLEMYFQHYIERKKVLSEFGL